MPDGNSNLRYVNASNGKIYIGGILIDDIYDIQYSYRESKEPIYGYNSKHYDAIVPGNVIVHGSFSINYRHDSYITKVLEKVKGSAIVTDSARIQNAHDYQLQYRKLLSDYKAIDSKIKQAKIDKETATSGIQTLEILNSSTINTALDNLQLREDEYVKNNEAYNNLYDKLTDEQKDIYDNQFKFLSEFYIRDASTSKEYKTIAQQAMDKLKNEYPDLAGVYEADSTAYASGLNYMAQQDTYDSSVNSASDNITKVKANLIGKTAVYDGLIQERAELVKKIRDKKNEIDSINVNWDNLAKSDKVSSKISQPEDMGTFNIYIRFKGMTHVIIEECTIVSHSLGIGASEGASAIKQYIQFIAKRVS